MWPVGLAHLPVYQWCWFTKEILNRSVQKAIKGLAEREELVGAVLFATHGGFGKLMKSHKYKDLTNRIRRWNPWPGGCF